MLVIDIFFLFASSSQAEKRLKSIQQPTSILSFHERDHLRDDEGKLYDHVSNRRYAFSLIYAIYISSVQAADVSLAVIPTYSEFVIKTGCTSGSACLVHWIESQ